MEIDPAINTYSSYLTLVILENFPRELDGALFFHETQRYTVMGEIKFGEEYTYLENGCVVSWNKQILDSLGYVVITWHEGIRDSIVE